MAGKYKSNKEGVYLREAGLISAVVKVKDDSRMERTLRLTSIRLKKDVDKDRIVNEIADLTRRLRELETKVKEL